MPASMSASTPLSPESPPSGFGRPSPRLLHPLMGANISTLVQILAQNGPVPLSCLPHVAIALGAAVLRWPFSQGETIWVAQKGRSLTAQPDPIFIVGHWRSGTTFLYSVLSRSPEFGYVSPLATGLPWDFLTLGNGLRPILEKALPRHRFIDQVQVNPDSPQEDEIALANMQTVSFYHGLYFPEHFRENFDAGIFFDGCNPTQIETWKQAVALFFKKLQMEQPQKRLLIKNPVYSARIQLLRTLWPGAKFIHIYRNPYIVFQSTRNFYRALFQELSLQSFDQVDIDAVILESYPRMMELLAHDTATLSAPDFVDVRFETFEANPLGELERIYETLALDEFETVKSAFATYLESQGTYRKNRYQFPDEDNEKVRISWKYWLERWGYEPPN